MTAAAGASSSTPALTSRADQTNAAAATVSAAPSAPVSRAPQGPGQRIATLLAPHEQDRSVSTTRGDPNRLPLAIRKDPTPPREIGEMVSLEDTTGDYDASMEIGSHFMNSISADGRTAVRVEAYNHMPEVKPPGDPAAKPVKPYQASDVFLSHLGAVHLAASTAGGVKGQALADHFKTTHAKATAEERLAAIPRLPDTVYAQHIDEKATRAILEQHVAEQPERGTPNKPVRHPIPPEVLRQLKEKSSVVKSMHWVVNDYNNLPRGSVNRPQAKIAGLSVIHDGTTYTLRYDIHHTDHTPPTS